jgi:hypothetical protein
MRRPGKGSDVRHVGEIERTLAAGSRNAHAIYAAERQAAMLQQLDRQTELLDYIAHRLHEMANSQQETNRLLAELRDRGLDHA